MAALVALSCAAYANGLNDIFHGLDALESVRDNEHIRQLWPLSEAMSLNLWRETLAADPGAKGGSVVRRPILSLSFALNYVLLGPEAWKFQLVNIIVHALAALLLFGLIRRTLLLEHFGGRFTSQATWIALGGAALWLVHPVHTESVTYLVQRAESMMGFFYLATLYCFLRSATAHGRSRTAFIVLATIACALGMGTKEGMVTAPVTAFLYSATFLPGGFSGAVRARGRLHAALAASWLVMAALLLTTLPDVRRDFEEGRNLAYMLSQPRVLLHYIGITLWPKPLYLYVNTQLYFYRIGLDPLRDVIASGAAMAALLAASVWGLRHKHAWGFLGITFFVLLSPSSTVVATSDTLQEHRVYLASSCVILTVLAALVGTIGRVRIGRWAIAVLIVGIVGVLVNETRARNHDYESQFGMIYPPDLTEAVEITVRHEQLRGRSDLVWGIVNDALRTTADPMIRARILCQLGYLYMAEKKYAEAENAFRQSLLLEPHYEIASGNLSVALTLSGNPAAAREVLEEVMKQGAYLPTTLNNLAVLRARDGDVAGAIKMLRDGALVHVEWVLLKVNADFLEHAQPGEIASTPLEMVLVEDSGEVALLLYFQPAQPTTVRTE